MIAQVGLGAVSGAALVPFVLIGAGGVLLLLALLSLWLLVAGIRAWNIARDVAAPSFDRQASHG